MMTGNNSSRTVPDLICSYLEPNTSCPLPTDHDLHVVKQICTAARTQGYLLFTVALVFGLPGSILAFITVSRMSMKPSTLYLCLLSTSDFISLVFISFTYYKTLDLERPTDWEDLSKWIGRLFQAVSHWLLVLICIERFVTVRFPFRKAALYTMSTPIWTTVAAVLLSSVPLTLYCLHKTETVTHSKFRFYYIIVYLSIYIFVPMTLIVVLTSLTAIELKRSQKRRRSLMGAATSAGANKMEADLTRMMFLSAICFVILTFPFFCFHTFDRIDDYWFHFRFCVVEAAVEYILLFSCASLSFLNHAINFYVYMIGAPGFRRQFLQLLPCNAGKTDNTETTTAHSISLNHTVRPSQTK